MNNLTVFAEMLVFNASKFNQMGFNVVPSHGKIPLMKWQEFQEVRKTIDEIEGCMLTNADGISLILGFNDIHAIDIDDIVDETVLDDWLNLLQLPINYSWIEQTGSGNGYQIFFLSEGELPITFLSRRCLNGKCGHVELRWKHCISVIPPSIHPDTNLPYKWIGTEPTLGNLAILNAGNVRNIYLENTQENNIVSVEQRPSGSSVDPHGKLVRNLDTTTDWSDINYKGIRHLKLCSFVGKLIARNEPEILIQSQASLYDKQCNNPPLGVDYVKFHVSDLYERYSKKWAVRLTDSGVAERLEDIFDGTLRYNHSKQTWMIWNGIHWEIDEKGYTEQLALQVIRMIQAEIIRDGDYNEKAKLIHQAIRYEDKAKIRNMLACAQTLPSFATTEEEYDTDVNLICLKNGCYDLENDIFLPPSPKYMQSKCTPILYDKNATCPKFLEFLELIFGKNKEIIDFIQRILGYSLTGDVGEKAIFFCHGAKGDNGKSTIFEVMLHIFGDYGLKTSIETLMAKKNETGGATPELVRLRGARFVATDEVSQGKRMNESMVKSLTGCDTVNARDLYEKPMQFKVSHKIWVAGNYLPLITGTDDAIWNRVCMIPFDRSIPKEKQLSFPKVQAMFRQETSGIFNWMLDGLRNYKRIGLAKPNEILMVNQQYRDEMDVIKRFIHDCIEATIDSSVDTVECYRTFKMWCEKNGERWISSKSFITEMERLGYSRKIMRGNRKSWIGIKIVGDESIFINGGEKTENYPHDGDYDSALLSGIEPKNDDLTGIPTIELENDNSPGVSPFGPDDDESDELSTGDLEDNDSGEFSPFGPDDDDPEED